MQMESDVARKLQHGVYTMSSRPKQIQTTIEISLDSNIFHIYKNPRGEWGTRGETGLEIKQHTAEGA